MAKYCVVFGILFIVGCCRAGKKDYCDVTCNGELHTICSRKKYDCGPGPACGPDFKEHKLTRLETNLITDTINDLRNKLALGKTSRPAAANIRKINYNKELERIAQCWINSCTLEHDTCRNINPDELVGQNLLTFHTNDSEDFDISDYIVKICKHWFEGMELFNTKTKNKRMLQDYYRFVYSETTDVGCGMASWLLENSTRINLFGCNFSPSISISKGMRVYRYGEPASTCKSGLKSSVYKGLCL